MFPLLPNRQSLFVVLGLITSLCMAAPEKESHSWEEEEQIIKQHLVKLAEQQNTLSEEMRQLRAELENHHKNIEDLKDTQDILNETQNKQKQALGHQLHQALKWGLKNQASDHFGFFEKDHFAKIHLLTKVFEQQKAQLRQQLSLIKEFDEQISQHFTQQESLQSELSEREHFFERLMQNDAQLQSLLKMCQEEHQKDLEALSQSMHALGASAQILSSAVFCPQSLSVPLPLFTGRQQKDFFGATVISGKEGEAISAVGPGKVIFSDQMKGLGKVIMVEHDDGYLSLYGNCGDIFKKIGESVSTGEQIATVGKSGQLGVSALYFEFRHESKLIPPQWDQEKD